MCQQVCDVLQVRLPTRGTGRCNRSLRVAESSLALGNYVSGYVTKPEKSSMQEVWQEVSDAKSVYSRLWKFGAVKSQMLSSGWTCPCLTRGNAG